MNLAAEVSSSVFSRSQVNSEYYTGWLDHWGTPHKGVATAQVTKYLDEILQLGANVNM